MINRALLRDRVKRKILDGIFDLSPDAGHYLLAERDLARRLKVSRKTVRAALEELEREGRVFREQGRGTRIARFKESSVGTVAVVFGSSTGTAAQTTPAELLALAEGISVALGTRTIPAIFCPANGYAAETLGTNATSAAADFAEAVRRHACAAVLMEWQHSVDVAHELEAMGFPYIVANLEEDADVRHVAVDFHNAGKQMASFISRCGYKRVLCLVGQLRRFVFEQFMKGFERGWKGRKPERRECFMTLKGSVRSVLEDALRSKILPEAIVTYGDERTLETLDVLEECGLSIPEDIGLICFGRTSRAVRERAVTGLAEPCDEVGRAAVQILIDLCRGIDVPRRMVLNAPLIQGKTMSL